jgi:hypothetical protein
VIEEGIYDLSVVDSVVVVFFMRRVCSLCACDRGMVRLSRFEVRSIVGAQHQNAKAERDIQTIMYMARTFMVHSSLHWTNMGADDISLWPFAVQHAVWLYNRVPNQESGLTPLELITK